jgi:peroxiredoxin
MRGGPHPSTQGTRSRCAAVAALLLLLLAVIPSTAGQADRREAYLERFLGKAAPPFALKDVKGREVKLADYRGKVVLLNFWYSACFPCRAETPDLIALYQSYKDRGLVVLGINTDPLVMPEDQGSMLRTFLDTFKIPYPVLMADRKIYEDYGRTPIAPITLMVERRGTIAQVFWGATRGGEFETAIRPYLATRASGAPAPGARPGP